MYEEVASCADHHPGNTGLEDASKYSILKEFLVTEPYEKAECGHRSKVYGFDVEPDAPSPVLGTLELEAKISALNN